MKKYQVITIITVLILIHIDSATAQFNNPVGNSWNTATSNVDRLNIGTGTTYPSVLFVDGANTYGSNTGNVFSTNGPGSTTTSWKMSQGGTENFRVENGSASDNIDLKAITGSMKFWTDGTQRMCITPASSSGFIGIGAGFNSPKSRLHINQGGAGNDVQFQMTTDGTNNNNSSQGLGITVIDNTLNVEFKQYENADMLFYTNSAEQVRIKNSGDVGIATSSPSARLHVVGVSPTVDVSATTAIKAICDGNDHATTVTGVYVDVADAKPLVTGTVLGIDLIASSTDAQVIGIRSTASVSKSQSGPTSSSIGGQFTAYAGNTNGASACYGITATASGAYSSGINYGGSFGAGGDAIWNYGVDATTTGGNSSSYSVGVKGSASAGSVSNWGVYGVAAGTGSEQIGVLGYSIDANSANNIGVKGDARQGTANYGVWGFTASNANCTIPGGPCSNAAGYFNGNLVYTGSFGSVSDSQFKNNIAPLDSATWFLSQIEPKSFVYNIQAFPGFNFPSGKCFGVIAQDIETILPGIVKTYTQPEITDTSGIVLQSALNYKTVDYLELIPILISGHQNQQLIIDSLINIVSILSPNSNWYPQEKNNMKITLYGGQSAILYQNEPNPFSDKTIIRYDIPETVKNASLVFYSSTGVRMKEVILNQKGEGQVEVETGTITNGIYSYSLFVDGKNADTKRMMKMK